MTLIYIIELIGTLVFAISGVLTAVEKKFDLVGATAIGFVTAIGGGTIRDLLIGNTPVGWMRDINIVIIIFSAIPICFFFTKYINKLKKGTFIFDTIGLGLFTIMGMQKVLALGLSPIIAILMGIVSAVFGGIIRDVLVNREPLIFRKEIYASACLAGALVHLLLLKLTINPYLNISISVFVTFIIRYFSVRKHWEIPFTPLALKQKRDE